MAKSKIIKELANKEISLDVAFNRLLIIASNIGNTNLTEWAINELNGYSNTIQIPKYRISGIGQIEYSGINGGYEVKRIPLPFGAIDEDIMQLLKETKFSHDIVTLEKFASDGNTDSIGRNLTDLAPMVYKNTGIQCVNIYMKFSKEVFCKILSNIRTKLLSVFLELDKELGCLDGLDIDTTDKKLDELNEKIKVIIYEDNSITIGNNNELKNNVFQKLGGKNNGN